MDMTREMAYNMIMADSKLKQQKKQEITYETNDFVEPTIGKGMTYQEKIILLGREKTRKIAEQKELIEQKKLELAELKKQKKQEIAQLIESQYSNLNDMIEKAKLEENKSAHQVIAEIYNSMPVTAHSINGLSYQFNELLKRYYGYDLSYIESYIRLPHCICGAEACEWLLKHTKDIMIDTDENLCIRKIYRAGGMELEHLMEKENSKYTKFSLDKTHNKIFWLNIKALEDIDTQYLDSILLDYFAEFNVDGRELNLPHFKVKLDVIKDDIVIDQHICEFTDKAFTVLLMGHLFNNSNQG